MEKKDEPGRAGSESLNKFNAIVANNFYNASLLEQKNYQNSVGGGGIVCDTATPYLTNTDNSTSTPVKNWPDFQHKSFELYIKTMQLFNEDKKSLQTLHARGMQKLKYINESTMVLYSPANRAGNSHSGWDLAKEISDTQKARLASKQLAWEKAMCNTDIWRYFGTFTLDKTKQDRYEFDTIHRILRFVSRRQVPYFLVPERHQDGAWHAHALLGRELEPFLSEMPSQARKIPRIANRIASGIEVQHCPAYAEKFGFNDIETIQNVEACCHYILKYITKSFDDDEFDRASRRRFFTSTGLKTPQVLMPWQVDLESYTLSGLSQYTEKAYLKRKDYSIEELQAETGDSKPGEPSGTQVLSPTPVSPVMSSTV